MMWRNHGLGIILTIYTVVQGDPRLACDRARDGHLLPYPGRCDRFIECSHGRAFVKECSNGLHFSNQRGVCDYVRLADCKEEAPVPKAGYDAPSTRRQNAHDYNTPSGGYKEYYTPEPPHQRPSRGRESGGYSTRPRFEETIYGITNNPYNFLQSGAPLREFGKAAAKEAYDMVKQRLSQETTMTRQMYNVIDSKPFSYVSNFMNAKPYVKHLALAGMNALQTTKLMSQRYGIFGRQLWEFLDPAHFELKPLPGLYRADDPMPVPEDMDYCPYPRRFLCDSNNPYRSFDGSCNNLLDGISGRSMLPFKRLVPAEYADGIEEMRRSVLGGPLPGAREVSVHMFPDSDRPNNLHTLLMMNFGQFVDHDLTRTAITKMSLENGVFDKDMMVEVKCGFDGCDSGKPGLEACWPIPIPHDDSDFPYNRCLKFVRSQEVPHLSCEYAPRDQLNQVTSWLDGSAIYGSTKEEADKLRDYNHHRGRMAVTRHPHGHSYKPVLPHGEDDLCRDVNSTVHCFSAGDERVNEQVGLSVIHTVWVREHNRIESELHRLNPHWDGERLYQETRKIVSAIMQHITFNEFLPPVLGLDILKRYGLVLEDDDYYNGYDTHVDPRPANVFATAAFRFGHTLIHEKIHRARPDSSLDDRMMLSQGFHRPTAIFDTANGGVDSIIRGMCEGPCQHYDLFFSKQISKSLFTETPPHGPGMDLLSLNIQRARDHGLPGYNRYREFCGLRKAETFDDLAYEIPDAEARNRLAHMYKSVDDIDIFVGGIAERSMAGGVVGPTFACLLGDTFSRVRKADRFWYENSGVFTKDQLNEIRKSRLSKLMCNNGDYIDKIQPWVLFYPSEEPDKYLHKLDDGVHNEVWFESIEYSNNYENERKGIPLKKPPAFLDEMFKQGGEAPQYGSSSPFNMRVPCPVLPEIDLTKWQHGPYTG